MTSRPPDTEQHEKQFDLKTVAVCPVCFRRVGAVRATIKQGGEWFPFGEQIAFSAVAEDRVTGCRLIPCNHEFGRMVWLPASVDLPRKWWHRRYRTMEVTVWLFSEPLAQ